MKLSLIIISILLLLLLIVITAVYLEDSCYYQVSRVTATASYDPAACKSQVEPVKFTISNESKYDLVQYGLTIAMHNRDTNDRAGRDAYTMHWYVPKGNTIDGCLPMPEVEDISAVDKKENYRFKIKFFIADFDTGNGNRRLCK